MKISLKQLGILLLLFLFVVSSYGDDPSSKEPSRHDRVYYLQHKLIPSWVHASDGQFYSDLQSGVPSPLKNAASEIVGIGFSDGISVRKIEQFDGFLILFPTPTEMTECYFAIVSKSGNGFDYYTLEMTEDILDSGFKSVVGMWTEDGSHLNMGPQRYTDEVHFIDQVSLFKKGANRVLTTD